MRDEGVVNWVKDRFFSGGKKWLREGNKIQSKILASPPPLEHSESSQALGSHFFGTRNLTLTLRNSHNNFFRKIYLCGTPFTSKCPRFLAEEVDQWGKLPLNSCPWLVWGLGLCVFHPSHPLAWGVLQMLTTDLRRLWMGLQNNKQDKTKTKTKTN